MPSYIITEKLDKTRNMGKAKANNDWLLYLNRLKAHKSYSK
jgi:hypothetical protein